jgi:hypothetical protein
MKIKFATAVFVLTLLFTGLFVFAQEPTATLVGRVEDPAHAVVPGVSIQVRNKDTNEMRTATTGKQGEYTVSALTPGNYDVLIVAPNFKEVHEPALTLEADQTARLDVQLVVGSTHEEVTVTMEIGTLNTETSDKGDVVSETEIAETPLNGRDFNDLVFNVGGVMPSEEGSKGSEFVANGARSDSSSVYVDGLNNTNPRDATAEATPPLDALQEFKVQTSNYSAEYGRMAGPVVNLVIKKGGNKLKGSVFEFVRNDIFDARNHFDAPGTQSELRRNQFGGTAGGPIFIPHFYNGHDKTFFMFSWESYRDVNASNELSTVPTALERSGDFSQSFDSITSKTFTTNQLKDELGNSACAVNNVIAKSCFDPVAQALVNFYPAPNLVGASNYVKNARNYDKWDNLMLKVDQQLASHDEASVKIQRRKEDKLNPFSGSPLGTFGSLTASTQEILGVTETHILTPTLINEFRAGITRDESNESALDAGTNWAAQLGIPGTNPPASVVEFPKFSVGSYAGLGDSETNPVIYTTNNYDYNDAMTWNKGKHTLKFGGDMLNVQYFQQTNSEFSGSLGFTGKTSGNGFADLLRGGVGSVDLKVGTVYNHLLDSEYSGYTQDDYKVFSSLTLNLGVRYEYQTLVHEEQGMYSNFVPALNEIVLASNKVISPTAWAADLVIDPYLALASQTGYPNTLVFPNKLRLAPRVGFAWRPFNNSRTTVRGGYGIFYTGSRISALRTDLAGQFPFTTTYNYLPTGTKGKITIENAFASTPSVSGITSANGYDPNAPSAYLQSYNFTVERELPKGIALEVAYTGSKGTHLGRKFNINQEALVDTSTSRPYSYFGSLEYYSFGSYSHYNAGTVTLRKRFEHGLMFRMNYSFAKSLDTASGLNYAGNGGYSDAQNSLNPNAEYGRSDSDRRHVVNGNWVYQLPFRRNIAVKGWGLAGSLQAETGTPLTPQYTVPSQTNGEATRPNRICDGALPSSQRSQNQWFNPACFVNPQPMTAGAITKGIPDVFGNSGRNILTGPNRITLAASLSRMFPVREYGKLQFRWEVFNATNHTNFNTPIDTLDTVDAGTIESSQDPRIMQVGAKFIF